MQNLSNDIRYAFRTLRKKPGFTLLAAFVLALGIGFNAATFSTVDALLLRPLDLPELDRLAVVTGTTPDQSATTDSFDTVAPADFLDFQHENKVFEHSAAYDFSNVNLTGIGEPERISGVAATADFFKTIGAEPVQGRSFLPEETVAGRNQVVVISEGLRERRFAGRSDVVGSLISLNDKTYTIIGVMAPNFDFPKPAQLWFPMVFDEATKADRKNQYLQFIGRLKPGISTKQAKAELSTIAARLERDHPATNTGRGVRVDLLRDRIAGDITSTFIWILTASVNFVLLLACVNVANMMLARSTSRHKELAVRAALGATRMRIVRQLLTESVLIALIGGIFAVFLAALVVEHTRTSIPPEITQYISGWKNITLSGRTLAVNFVVALMTGVFFGLVPALQVSKPDLNETLKSGGKTTGGGGDRRRMQNALVVAEIALALVLAVGAGMMVNGFSRLVSNQRQGFQPDNLLTFRVTLPEAKYPEKHRQIEFFKQALERIREIPQVEAASTTNYLPVRGQWNAVDFLIEGRPEPQPGKSNRINMHTVEARYFQTMGIPLVSGRAPTDMDAEGKPLTALVSAATVRKYWPDRSPLGERIRFEPDNPKSPQYTIVGVVGDVTRFVFDREPQPTVYLSARQVPWRGMYFVVRTSGDPLSVVSAVRAKIGETDPNLPLYDIFTMDRVFFNQTCGIRLAAVQMSLFGFVALVLATVGVYGLTAYSVVRRTNEIGIRTALGASQRDILNMIVGQALKLAGIGLGIGLPLAFGLGSVMSSALFGIFKLDVAVFAGFVALLTFTALAAAYFPARRAARTDPMTALRTE